MEIVFRSKNLAKVCSSEELMRKRFGNRASGRLARHLVALEASTTLADFAKFPQTRCHELKGNRDEQISIDLIHPLRVVAEVSNNPVPRKEDGGLDWNRITALTIIDITDTHK